MLKWLCLLVLVDAQHNIVMPEDIPILDPSFLVTEENYEETLKAIPHDISMRVDGKEYDNEKYLPGGVFSNVELLQAILDGHVICYPFRPNAVQGASIDFLLGTYYWKTDEIGSADFYEFLDADEVKRYFRGPYEAATNNQWAERLHRLPIRGIPEDHPVIVLRPGERVLAHTHEFIGIKPPGTTDMKARSTIGRDGIVVCKDAGWGDPGYGGRWTMEIQNDNKESIALPVGFPVGQLVFFHTGRVAGSYTETGNYYKDKSLHGAIFSWHPDMMLPKARPDQVEVPLSIPGLGHLAVQLETQPRSRSVLPDLGGSDLSTSSFAALPSLEALPELDLLEAPNYRALNPLEE